MGKGKKGGSSIGMMLILLLAITSLTVHADSQRIVEYEYDGAGNIIGVRSGRNLGPPDVTSLEPAFININGTSIITATGINLAGATVTTTAPGVIVSNVVPSETTVTFVIRANQNAVIGPASLTFTTRLGSDSEILTVAEKTPVITSNPNPILLQPDNEPVQVSLLFAEPFATDQIFDVLIMDTSIATITEQTVTLPAGAREVTLNITGITAGTTTLQINQLSNFLALGIPVIVADPFQLPPGNQFIASRPLGVTLQNFALPQGNNSASSQPLGVLRNTFELPAGNNTPLSQPLGVLRNSFELPAGDNEPLSEAVGVTFGATAEQVTPSQVSAGSPATLTITGTELDLVTAVDFLPANDITQTAPFSVNGDGTQLQIFIDVAANAATGPRQIILTTPNGAVPFSEPGGNILEITP